MSSDKLSTCLPPHRGCSVRYGALGTDRQEGKRVEPTRQGPRAFPISIKGVVVRDGKVLLLRNERDEWELPGGRIEVGETPEECVAREIHEATKWKMTTGPIDDT